VNVELYVKKTSIDMAAAAKLKMDTKCSAVLPVINLV
jgi:hypothetical protein